MKQIIDAKIESILRRCQAGDTEASDELFDILYPDLKRIASNRLNRQSMNITAQTTEIVNELYIKFNQAKNFPSKSRLYFFSIAATAIEQIIIDHARHKNRLRRGGDMQQVELNEKIEPLQEEADDQLLELGYSLHELKEVDPIAASILSLKLFVGLKVPEISEVMNVSTRTVSRKWSFAKSYLRHHLMGA